jgi:FAD/FMN-containing dehydrogenase
MIMREHISTQDIELYSTDSSIFKVVPSGIVFPKNIQDIQNIVKYATQEQKVISVRAGGTCMCGGSLSSGIILDLKKHMHNIQMFPYSTSAVVEMGAYYRDVETAANPHHLMFAPYTSSKDICGIGGMIGNNASGEKSIRYGGTVDNVQAITVVLHDGEVYTFEEISEKECIEIAKEQTTLGHIYRTIRDMYHKYGHAYEQRVGDVKKTASGYRLEKVYDADKKTWNLAKLFVGSQATLGVIASARLKLVSQPLYTRTTVIPVHDLSVLPNILQTIMKYNPEGVETFDVNTWHFGKQFLPEDTLRISEYFAKGEKLLVLAQFSESTQIQTDTKAHACIQELVEIVPRAAYIADPLLVQSVWAVRRSSFKILRDATYDNPMKKAVPCIEDVIVPISRYDVFIPKLLEILQKNNLEFGFHGHIGDGAIRIIPIIDFTNREAAISQIEKICVETFSLIKELKGNMSADHGDGIIRTPFLKEFYGDMLYEQVILRIKKLFDPHGVFNVDKKISIHVEDWADMVRW